MTTPEWAADIESHLRQQIHTDSERLRAKIAEWEPRPCPDDFR